jgi:hypothetical protein
MLDLTLIFFLFPDLQKKPQRSKFDKASPSTLSQQGIHRAAL